MNRILPFGVSALNTNSSKFNLDAGSVLIGLNAGTSLTDIDNVFIGNSAGNKSLLVGESIFIGMYAGQNIETGRKSIIIGNDKATNSVNKNDIISVGYNSIENSSIGIGSNIYSVGTGNILVGKDIVCEGFNTYTYGNNLTVKNSYYFIDSLIVQDNKLLLDGFDKIGLIDIKANTNYYSSNLFYIQYELNNLIKSPETMFMKETDIIFKFIPREGQNFEFNLGFYMNSCNLINFNFKRNIIEYINKELSFDITYSINVNQYNPWIYNKYNIIHFVNNDKNYNSLSLYINPIYNGYVIDKDRSRNYTQGFINSIQNTDINIIRLSYTLGSVYNVINSNYIFSDTYKNKYYIEPITIDSSNTTSNITSNIISNVVYNTLTTIDYTSFNNALAAISFKDFIISVNDISDKYRYNILHGKDINIKGTNNISIGNNHNVEGDNSIFIGNSLSTNKIYKNSKDSIVIGNSNFINNFTKNSIILGNNNFNNLDENNSNYYGFLSKNPIVIGNNIQNIDYHLNIYDTIVKYDDASSCNEILLSGYKSKYNNFLPVAIGFSSNSDLPIKGLYKLEYVSNTYMQYGYSNFTKTVMIDGILQEIEDIVLTSNLITEISSPNNKILTDDKYALYTKNGIYTDTISVYNNTNYSVKLSTNNELNQNIQYVLPKSIDNYNSTKNIFLSYRQNAQNEKEMYWNTLESVIQSGDLNTKNIITTGYISSGKHITASSYISSLSYIVSSSYIFSSNFIGIGSNLTNLNLNDRDTNLLKEGSSNLYFTYQRSGMIAEGSNVKAMNYTLSTSNEIIKRIDSLTTNKIKEGSNLYYTSNRFDERFLTKTLDNLYNGTSNKYITNDIYTNNLLITGTLTVGKIQVLGVDFPNTGNGISFASQLDLNNLKTQVSQLSQTVNSLLARVQALESR